jgi:spermidine synthase
MRLKNSFVLVILLVTVSIRSLAATNTSPNDPKSIRRVDEEEEEIGYIQTLLLNTPALETRKSMYQKIEIYESDHFGKVFLLDDCLQLTERDAPHYNEMLAHVPVMEYLSSAGKDKIVEPLDILVLGGGDGYVVSELLKYPNIGSIDHVDLDREVVNVSKDHFPWAKSVWDNDKVNLVVGDGAKYVEEQAANGKSYHVIIQDASDPFWVRYDGSVVILPSHVLYDEAHFQRMHELLEKKNGVLMYQAETYNIPSNLKEITNWRRVLSEIGFGRVRYGTIAISTYPTGQIGFFVSHAGGHREENVCSSDNAPASCDENVSLDWIDWIQTSHHFNSLSGKTKYYHPRIHRR